MDAELLATLRAVTEEEQLILDGETAIQRTRYTSGNGFVFDSRKLIEKGQLIVVRPHTRFIYFPMHRHDYVELVYQCKGNTTHLMNKKEKFLLSEGDLLFLNQHVYHEILPAGMDDIAVNFIILPAFFEQSISVIEPENVLRDFLISTLSPKNGESNYLHIQAKGILPVENLLESMIWSLLREKRGTNTINQTAMQLLFLYLSSFVEKINCSNTHQREQTIVFSVLRYIDTAYADGSLADIAAQLDCTTYYISKLLKKHTGKNFKELLQQRKLQQAAYLLEQTPLPVSAVLERIGYDNSSYFYRCFRSKYGCSPNEYRAALCRNSV